VFSGAVDDLEPPPRRDVVVVEDNTAADPELV